MFGDTNLRTFVDGARVLRTIVVERLAVPYRNGSADRFGPALDLSVRAGLDVAPTFFTAPGAARAPRIPVAARIHGVRNRNGSPPSRSVPPRADPSGSRSQLSGLWRSLNDRAKGRTR
jgi:hypothetical protein